jgi:beta-lactamase regulating signal transducer with metallopeptidase domain
MSLTHWVADSPLAYRIGCGLVHFLWEGTLMAAALAVALRALRGRPAARHTAAWLTLAGMAAAVPLTAWLVPAPPERGAGRPIASPQAVANRAPVPEGSGARPAVAGAEARPAPVESPSSSSITAGSGPRVAAVPGVGGRVERAWALGSVPGEVRIGLRPLAAWVVTGWLAGTVLLALWRLGGWLHLRRLCRRGTRPVPGDVQERFDRLAARLGMRRSVRLVEATRVDVPAVLGWLCPVILLPVGLAAGLPPGQLELILAHELAHVRRHDFLANLVQTAVETCLFYHPVVWWVSRRIRVEREACCDDLVVAATGERLLYARALAVAAGFRAGPAGRRPAGLPVAVDGGDLLDRVRRVLGLPGEERHWSFPQLAGAAAALALAAPLAGYLAIAREAPFPPADQDRPASAAPKPEPPSGRSGTPKVVRVSPADGAPDVDPVSEIRVRFDRPMDPTRSFLEWDTRGPAGYRRRGEMRYESDTHQFVIPVRLTPGVLHKVRLNHENPVKDGVFEGFESAEHVAAEPRSWSFTTARPASKAGDPPKVIAVTPPGDSEVTLITNLELTFDRPMDPERYNIVDTDPHEFERKPGLAGPVSYDETAHRLTLPLSLPPNWNGEVRLDGFRSRDGVETGQPVVLKYRTMREVLPSRVARRVEGAGRSPELLRFVESVRDARRKLSSVSERALTVSSLGLSLPGWHQRLESQGATFKMSGDRRFYGEVDAIMRMPFRVGSDGKDCWLRFQDQRTSLPFDDVAEKNVRVCDAFDAFGRVDAAQFAQDRQLEDLGETLIGDRRCRRVRSWSLQRFANDRYLATDDFYFDARTLLPVRVEITHVGTPNHVYTIDFAHSRVNEPIPDDEFRPGGLGGKAVDPPPLGEGYTHRFLNVDDGSGGGCRSGWGRRGRGGRTAAG